MPKQRKGRRASQSSSTTSSARNSTVTERVSRATREVADEIVEQTEPIVAAAKDGGNRVKSEAMRTQRRVKERVNTPTTEGFDVGSVFKTVVVLGVLGIIFALFGTDFFDSSPTKGRIARAPTNIRDQLRAQNIPIPEPIEINTQTSNQWYDLLQNLTPSDTSTPATDDYNAALRLLNPPAATAKAQERKQRRSQSVRALSDVDLTELATTDPLIPEKVAVLHQSLRRRQDQFYGTGYDDYSLLIGDNAFVLQQMIQIADMYWDPVTGTWVDGSSSRHWRRGNEGGKTGGVKELGKVVLELAKRELQKPGPIDRDAFVRKIVELKEADDVGTTARSFGIEY
ncbi:hypothetical protein HK097_005142 [Rhizophlyctis rosea]|uniref:Uncharacterized protein n=1 Tax=Rhizophlyctis rosea TaxID=64517 RepID=A0AAD5SF87_9FUNG|nr:hypothetical protein HK097_005142 [Rhizophlyctis rosea]